MTIERSTHIQVGENLVPCIKIKFAEGASFWYMINHGNSARGLTLTRIKTKKLLAVLP